MDEYEVEMTCEAEDVTVIVMGLMGKKWVEETVEGIGDRFDGVILRTRARQIEHEIEEVALKRCSFEGPVMVRYHRGEKDWTCPLCKTEHREEVD